MKKYTVFMCIAMLLLFVAGCGKNPELGGEWKMGGPYNQGKPCKIVQRGDVLTFVNENGDESSGTFKDRAKVEVKDWEGGLEGVLADGATRINWKNGTWWLKAK